MKLLFIRSLLFSILFLSPLLFCRISDLGVEIYLGSADHYELYGFDNVKNVQGELIIGPKYDFDWYKEFFEDSDNIDLQLYSLSLKDALDMFKQRSRWGVNIRMILEDSKYLDNSNSFNKLKIELESKGVQVKTDDQMGTKYIHSKLFLLDDKFIIQSANLTYTSFNKNREHFFVSYDREILNNLRKIFEKDWNGIPINKDEIQANLFICNINCRDKIESLLNLAKESIYIETMNIDDERLLSILKDKSDLNFKMILANTDSNKDIQEQFGVDTVKYMSEPFLHAKSILIDNKYLLVGSINLTTNSMDNNREAAILLLDENLINKFKNSFDNDRERSE